MRKMMILAALALLGGQACLADSYIWEEHFTGPDGTDLLSLGKGYTYEGGPNIEIQLSADRGISVSNAAEAAYYRIDIPDFSLASLAAGQELVMSVKSEVQVGGGGFFHIGARDADGEDFWVGMSPGVPRFDIGANFPNVDTNPGVSQPPLPANGGYIEMRTMISSNQSRFEWRSFPNGSWTDIGAGTYSWGSPTEPPTVFETLHLRFAGDYNNATFDDWEVYVYPAPVQTATNPLVQEDFSGSGDLATKGYLFSSSTPGGTEPDIQLSGGTGIRSGDLPEAGTYSTNIPCFFSLASLVGTQALMITVETVERDNPGFLQVGATDVDGQSFYVGYTPSVTRFDLGANFPDVDVNITGEPLPSNGETFEMRTLITSNSSTFEFRTKTPTVGAWNPIGAGTYSWGSPSNPPTVFKNLFIKVADDYGSDAPFDNWEVSIFAPAPPPPPPTFGAVIEIR